MGVENPDPEKFAKDLSADVAAAEAAKKSGAADANEKKDVELRDHDREAEIKKLAYYIWEHRMAGVSGDNEKAKKRQRGAAKEYGFEGKDLDKFVGTEIDKMLVKEGLTPGTEPAREFMEKWDWKIAEGIYEAKKNEWFKKEGGEEPLAEPVVEPAAATPGPEAAEPAKEPDVSRLAGTGAYTYIPRPGDEFLSKEDMAKNIAAQQAQAAEAGKAEAGAKPEGAPGTEGGPKNGTEKPKETDFEKKKKEMEKEMNEAADKYARLYSETKSKQNLIKRALGFWNVEKDPAVEKAREKYVDLRQKYNRDMLVYIKEQHTSGKITENEAMDQINNLTEEAYINHDFKLQEKKMQYRIMADKDPKRGWFSSRVETGYNKFIEKYRKLPWWAKVGTSLALAGSGIGLAAAGALGAASVVGFGMVGMRVAGGLAAGKGTQEFLQAQADKFRQRRGQIGVERMKDISKMEGMNLEEKFLYATKLLKYGDQDMDQRFKRMESGDNIRRGAGMAAGLFVVLGVSGMIIRETGLGGWMKEKIFGSLPGTGGAVKPGMGVPENLPKPVGGGPPMVEGGGKFRPDIGDKVTGAEVPKGSLPNMEPQGPKVPVFDPDQVPGKNITAEGYTDFSGDTARINKGSSIWRTTRDIFIKNADQYGYKPDDPKIHKLFNNFQHNGILEKMGIDADSFNDLSDDDKIRIWAENRTANSVKAFSNLHGGKINDLVHPGDSIAMDEHGRILFGETSGVKAGQLHDYARTSRGGGSGAAAAYEPQGRGGAAASAHETAGKRPDFLKEFDEKQRIAKANYAEKAAAAAKTHDALVQSREPLLRDRMVETIMKDNTQMHKWMDFIQERIHGPRTAMDWHEKASDFRKRMFNPLLTSDQPMGPGANAGEQQQYWRAAQELNRRLGPTIGDEDIESWMQRGLLSGKVKPEDVVGVLRRVVNA